jgi:hypothetical protein
LGDECGKAQESGIGRRPLLFVGGGLVLACLAIGVGSFYQVGAKAALDFKGRRIEGNAERNEAGGYRIRYKHPSGAIYARMHRGGLGIQRYQDDQAPVEMAYDAEEPGKFQPAGLSYIPGGVSLALFFAAMSSLLHGRSLLVRKRRAALR